MARLPRLVVPGRLHLVLQRAHGAGVVFRSDDDYASYKRALMASAVEQRVALHAFALTPSQVLLLQQSAQQLPAAEMFQQMGRAANLETARRRQELTLGVDIPPRKQVAQADQRRRRKR